MGNFNKGGGGRFGNSGGGRDRGFGDRGGRSSMHRATCSDCGKSCEVPFKPTGNKPVYCSDCFKSSEKSGGRDRGGKEFGGRDRGGRDRDRGRGRSEMHRATCSTCGKSCEVPFKPTGDKPVYCDSCFGGGKDDGFKSRKTDESKEEFRLLNKKLDRIIKALEEAGIKKEAPIVKPVKEEEAPGEKPAKKTKKVAKKKPAAKKTAKKKAAKKKAAKKKSK